MTDTPADPSAGNPVEALSFEEALAELEAVVTRLERGDVALDESIALYERGALLRAHCQKKLADAEERVSRITLRDGQPVGLQPLEDR
ncbi:Exodeoxyribonuclease VII small subunit [Rubellimicrobium thermophilum DSM 16684]|uniref:Exodeoxyribonuclease 7 small subunit n=1 Tax=Rubellimicrobium thermophilum DSM 16684 TaxID=1123069 RepID=S9QX47_9RHOB|nr:exodeoxyribonuclease VII small subunit [Rubellimicrobium thermophilum]EPX84132.1 Exodeoxyribonuclease VII small subunit [Rubellimicrobium thermophilum DSM 16684]